MSSLASSSFLETTLYRGDTRFKVRHFMTTLMMVMMIRIAMMMMLMMMLMMMMMVMVMMTIRESELDFKSKLNL